MIVRSLHFILLLYFLRSDFAMNLFVIKWEEVNIVNFYACFLSVFLLVKALR